MGWRDRAAGHAILEEAGFARLEALPKTVAFQIRLFQHKKRKLWFLGTRSNLKKWQVNDDPFCELAPAGSPEFVKLAAETAAPFCAAFDELHALAKEALPGSQYAGFGPSKKIGELSLGLQMATLLGTRVFSFIDDDDPCEAIFSCICEPGRVVRARSQKAGVHILFDGGTAAVSQVGKARKPSAFRAVYPEGYTPPQLFDVGPVVDRLATLPGVKKGKKPKDYADWSKQLVSQELNAFAGADIAEPDTVVPSYASMKRLAQRTAGGKLVVF
jgi:hypothetical protein